MDLGSLNLENIENILSSMSSEDMEMIKNAAQGLLMSSNQGTQKKESNTSSNTDFFSSFDFETVSKIISLMEKLKNQPNDPRCNLLLSLKPMLSEKRQSRVDDAVKILSLLSFLPFIEELGGR